MASTASLPLLTAQLIELHSSARTEIRRWAARSSALSTYHPYPFQSTSQSKCPHHLLPDTCSGFEECVQEAPTEFQSFSFPGVTALNGPSG